MRKPPYKHDSAELSAFADVLRGRRTVNLYRPVSVSRELVLDAIQTAAWAPNHHVTEPWRFYLLGDETIGRCLDLCETIVAVKKSPEAAAFKRQSWSEKPGWLVVTCRRSDDAHLEREDYAACAAAVQNLLLHLWAAGVGSKWTTGDITRDARFADIVGFDADTEFVVGLIWYGYPKLTPSQSRKVLDDVVTERP